MEALRVRRGASIRGSFTSFQLSVSPQTGVRRSGDAAHLLGTSQTLTIPIRVREPSERNHDRWHRRVKKEGEELPACPEHLEQGPIRAELSISEGPVRRSAVGWVSAPC